MPTGGPVEVSVDRETKAHDDDHPGPHLVVRVKDHGNGIPNTHLAHIFEPFFTTKGVGHGTGLGLSVTHGIVEDHGGFIDVRSESGIGSTFAIHLPLKEASA
jgi:signal transduction histidine kinase